MSTLAQVHIVHRSDPTKHTSISCTIPVDPLPTSSVRARISRIAFTSNNLTYAHKGSILGFWDIFPIPHGAKAEAIEIDDYGIVPAFGYARVEESTVSSLPIGTLLHGVWPASSHSITMQLEPHDANNHYLEVSEHRKQFWGTVKRYVSFPASHKDDGIEIICKPLLEPALLLGEYVFPTDPAAVKPCHPLPPLKQPWGGTDADLSDVVTVILGASSKSGRALSWVFQRRRAGAKGGPKGLLLASSSVSSVLDFSGREGTTLPVRAASYASLADPDMLLWLQQARARRVVLFDFGGPSTAFASICTALHSLAIPLKVIRIGFSPAPALSTPSSSPEESPTEVLKIPFNTSDVRDYAVAIRGAEEHFTAIDAAYRDFVQDRGVEGMEVIKRFGTEGLKEAWADVSEGKVAGKCVSIVEF